MLNPFGAHTGLGAGFLNCIPFGIKIGGVKQQ